MTIAEGKEFIPRHEESGHRGDFVYYVEKDDFIHDMERTPKCYRVMARGRSDEGIYTRSVDEKLSWDDARTLANNMNRTLNEQNTNN